MTVNCEWGFAFKSNEESFEGGAEGYGMVWYYYYVNVMSSNSFSRDVCISVQFSEVESTLDPRVR